ncbi:MAG: hypothetical protein ACI8T1_001410 [Verrucomicrobiales bacterium]|jgi:hypothetical protein
MRITIEIDDSKLESIRERTGIEKMSPAIVKALDEFLRPQERDEFLRKVLSWKTDYSLTNDAFESLSEYDAVSS